MSFDYPYTCPEIDKAISKAKDALKNQIYDLLCDAVPMLSGEATWAQTDRYIDSFYDSVEDCFESAREANVSMRKEAERQVSALEDRVSALESQVEYLERSAA